jgi:hypothetical protein
MRGYKLVYLWDSGHGVTSWILIEWMSLLLLVQFFLFKKEASLLALYMVQIIHLTECNFITSTW